MVFKRSKLPTKRQYKQSPQDGDTLVIEQQPPVHTVPIAQPNYTSSQTQQDIDEEANTGFEADFLRDWGAEEAPAESPKPTKEPQKSNAVSYHLTPRENSPVAFLVVQHNATDKLMLAYNDIITAETSQQGKELVIAFSSGVILRCQGERLHQLIEPLQKMNLHCLELFDAAKHEAGDNSKPIVQRVEVVRGELKDITS